MSALVWVVGVLALVLGMPARAGSGPSAWGLGAMEKVRPQTPPGDGSRVQLFAARNEFVSFQVGLHGGDWGWPGVSARLSALEGPGRIEGGDLVLYRETLVPVAHQSLSGVEVGAWPDGLVPDTDETVGEKRLAFPLDVPAHESRALWVDVHVPMGAPPGDYHGSVEVVGGGSFARVEVSLTVVDWVMPSTSSLRTSFSVWTPSLCMAFTGQRECSREEQLRLSSDFLKLGLEHRITLSSRFDPQDRPDWATFDTWWGPYVEGLAPLRLPGARMTSVEYLGDFTAEALADFGVQAGARGWLPRALSFPGDEPPYGISFDEVRARARLSRQAEPRLRTVLTISSLQELERQGLSELIDIATVTVIWLYTMPEQRVGAGAISRYEAFLGRRERELWVYQSCVTHGCGGAAPGGDWPSYMVDRPSSSARALEWISFQVGATGELYYQVAQMLSTAWTNQNAFGGFGDGTLFYPGTVSAIGGSTGVPLPSMRLKLIRLGMQDYEWLKAVGDAGDAAFARGVAQELIPTPWQVPGDGELFERSRVLLIQRYLTLMGAAVPESVTAYLREHPGPPTRDLFTPVRSAE
ncbi:MAG TPA: glycoside hydrolase domain-containing protein [Archangium sp.]|uniref:DUF4091 domain-containing protein n=1 Tax=Archangium sp. TaxID=1872627 RepID=UPI002E37A8C6|nr:glycoside hydrolase domain-containing protein [Archangium sp.]HEX5747163.1 glycoside hydrolase domain-containing protein [Archangium sp.]